jgi:hypothetical protein
MKVTWNIVKSETDKKSSNNGIHVLNIYRKLSNNHMIGNLFNTCFSTMADKLIAKSESDNSGTCKEY